MALPDLPVENQLEWFDERNAFDEAIRARLDGDLDPDILALQIATAVEEGSAAGLFPHPSYPWALIVGDGSTPPDPDNFPPSVTINTGGTSITDMDAILAWTGFDVEGSPLTYSVAWGDGVVTNPATSPATHSYSSGGTFLATVTASDGVGTGSRSHSFLSIDPSDTTSPYHAAMVSLSPVLYFPLDDADAPPEEEMTGLATTTTQEPVWGAVGIGDGLTSATYVSGSNVNLGRPAVIDAMPQWSMVFLCLPTSNSGTQDIITRDDRVNRSFTATRVTRKFNWGVPGGATVSTTLDYPAGTVYLVAFTYDGASIRVYVNRALAGSTATAAGAVTSKPVDTIIGIRASADAPTFTGQLAGVGFFNRPLTLPEITALADAAGIPT